MRVSELFKEYGERTKPTPNADNWYNNRSVWAKNGIQTSNHHPKVEDSDLKTLMNSGITKAKAINPTNKIDVDISVSASNRVEKIEVCNDLSIRYEDCTKVEEITDTKGYESYINEGYELYNVYRWNPYANIDTICCILATKK